jgi:hypothetical protein
MPVSASSRISAGCVKRGELEYYPSASSDTNHMPLYASVHIHVLIAGYTVSLAIWRLGFGC